MTTITLDSLRDIDQAFRNAQVAADEQGRLRRDVIRALLAQGYRSGDIADAIGVSAGRIRQIAGPVAARS